MSKINLGKLFDRDARHIFIHSYFPMLSILRQNVIFHCISLADEQPDPALWRHID